MNLGTGLAEQPDLLPVAHQAVSGAIRDPPSAAEYVVSVRLLVVSGSRGSEAMAREIRSLNGPVIVQPSFTARKAGDAVP